MNPRPPAPKAGALPLRHSPVDCQDLTHSVNEIGRVLWPEQRRLRGTLGRVRRWHVEAREIEAKSFPIGRRGYEKEAVDAYLSEVATAFRRLKEQATAAVEAQAAPPPPVTFDNVGSQVSAILATAAAAAEEMKAAAEKEAEEIRAAASQETEAARQALAERLAQSDQITTSAQEEAAAVLAAARVEAERLEQDARQRVEALEREVVERAAALERTAVANVEAMLADGTKQYERLRDVREQTADRLASVEAMIRKAREECSDEVARSAFKSARKAVNAAKRQNGAPAQSGPEATDGRKSARASGSRRTGTATPASGATKAARPARPARVRQG